MRISRIKIVNFRNFSHFEVDLSERYLIIVGENNVGKSNLIYALRLLLDISLPNSARHLNERDFWDGLEQPFGGNEIKISVTFADFSDDENEYASMRDCYKQENGGLISTLSYVFAPTAGIDIEDQSDLDIDDYDFYFCCDEDSERKFTDLTFQKFIPLEVLSAIRNASSDLSTWSRSPLSRLVNRLELDRDQLGELGNNIDTAISALLDLPPIADLQQSIDVRLAQMIGSNNTIEPVLGFLQTDPDRLMRFLRLYTEGPRQRSLDEIGTGYANVLFVILLLLDAQAKEDAVEQASMILAVEEPEVHLHPHLQRLIFRDLTNRSQKNVPLIVTTHSPHIASVAPLKSILALRSTQNGTIGKNAVNANLTDQEIADIERYIDVTRAELAFSKGVILVEGITEEIIITEFARLLGTPLDEFGITLINIDGIDFAPYVKLLKPESLGIPFAVITDGDPYFDGEENRYQGIERGIDLLNLIAQTSQNNVESQLRNHGIFVGLETLEIDLVTAGYGEEFIRVFEELGEQQQSLDNTRQVFEGWENLNFEERRTKLVAKIERVSGKGRFAQRLAAYLNRDLIPSYVQDAFTYLGII